MMPSVAELLERESTTVDLEGDHLERLLRRRDRKRRNERVRAGALAVILALLTFAALARAFSTKERTANELHPPLFTGMVVTYTGNDPRGGGDLVAQDPDTGEVRALVDAHSIHSELRNRLIGSAAVSPDGRWVAFEVVACGGGITDAGGAGGLWVTDWRGEPRQLTRPCFEDPEVAPYDEFWAWSPAGAQLVVARRSVDGDRLILIDPATGDRTDLGEAAGEVTSLAWSPDGTRIAYGAVPKGTRDEYSPPRGSVYSVAVGGGDHALLASSVGHVSGGETGSGILWSPDGTRIAVLTETGEGTRLYLTSPDGSELDLLTEGVVIAHVMGAPGLAWSPDGTRMAYATYSGGREGLRVWTASPDGRTSVLVFESPTSENSSISFAGGPVWSPDGTKIAFRYSLSGEGDGWLVVDADGTGDAREIDELRYLSWRGGWYFCECYG
jgi:Tol biopolymer transport system component